MGNFKTALRSVETYSCGGKSIKEIGGAFSLHWSIAKHLPNWSVASWQYGNLYWEVARVRCQHLQFLRRECNKQERNFDYICSTHRLTKSFHGEEWFLRDPLGFTIFFLTCPTYLFIEIQNVAFKLKALHFLIQDISGPYLGRADILSRVIVVFLNIAT